MGRHTAEVETAKALVSIEEDVWSLIRDSVRPTSQVARARAWEPMGYSRTDRDAGVYRRGRNA